MTYNRSEIEPGSRATAEQLNAEFIKIKAELDGIKTQLDGVVAGTPLASYTHVAFADSADGTANFTTGEPGSRSYIGIAYNQTSPTESVVASNYQWTRYRGTDGTDGVDGGDGNNGTDGIDGNYIAFRFIRSSSQPVTPVGADPVGWSVGLPPTGEGFIWFSTATKTAAGGLLTAWSAPERMSALATPVPYDAGATFYQGQTVLFGGGTYILTVPLISGAAPSGTDQANSNWDVIAAPGQAGEPSTPPSAFSATIDLTSSAAGVNLRTVADGAGYTGMSDATITFRVPSGVVISGNQVGGKGVDTGTWPSGYTVTLALVVQNGGKVYGGGGSGGSGGTGGEGFSGGAGGDGVFARAALTVTIDSGGELKGGGGGGKGGTAATFGFPEPTSTAGGGGGGGFPNGVGGAAGLNSDGEPGNDGSDGTILGGGAGGTGLGGGTGATGGAAATAGVGAGGGVAGYAVRKNGNTVPVTNNGTMTGTAA